MPGCEKKWSSGLQVILVHRSIFPNYFLLSKRCCWYSVPELVLFSIMFLEPIKECSLKRPISRSVWYRFGVIFARGWNDNPVQSCTQILPEYVVFSMDLFSFKSTLSFECLLVLLFSFLIHAQLKCNHTMHLNIDITNHDRLSLWKRVLRWLVVFLPSRWSIHSIVPHSKCGPLPVRRPERSLLPSKKWTAFPFPAGVHHLSQSPRPTTDRPSWRRASPACTFPSDLVWWIWATHGLRLSGGEWESESSSSVDDHSLFLRMKSVPLIYIDRGR